MAPQKAVLKFTLNCSLKEELTVSFMPDSDFTWLSIKVSRILQIMRGFTEISFRNDNSSILDMKNVNAFFFHCGGYECV